MGESILCQGEFAPQQEVKAETQTASSRSMLVFPGLAVAFSPLPMASRFGGTGRNPPPFPLPALPFSSYL